MNASQIENTRPNATPAAPSVRATPALDVYESPEELLAMFDVPGAAAESVDVQVIENELFVRAAQASVAHAGVAPISFERRIALPAEVDTNSAAATLRDGVLEVRLQKSPSARPVKIPVRAN